MGRMTRLYFSLLLNPEIACTDSKSSSAAADGDVASNCGCVGRVTKAMNELRRLLSDAELNADQLMRRLDELRGDVIIDDYCQ